MCLFEFIGLDFKFVLALDLYVNIVALPEIFENSEILALKFYPKTYLS